MAVRAIRARRGTAIRLSIVAALALALVGLVAQSAFSKSSPGKWVLGVSNTLVGNGWREEMICSVKAEATASGKVSKVIVADRNGSAAEQSADIRNLISAGVNAIVVDPADPKALNGVIAQAAARGIKVVSVDQTVTAPQAYNVTNDQTKYGYLGGLWLFKQMHGKGNVVEMRGIAGASADTDRHNGFMQALKKFPKIHVVKSTFTGWQYATGGKQMLDILNSGVKVDGVWTSGIDYTVVNAFKTAGKPLVPIVGADNNQFLKYLLTQYPKLKGAAVTNPATVGGAGAAVALKLLQGQKVAKNILLTPQVWTMPGSKAIMKKFYSPSLPPTYSDTLQISGLTHYSIGQLKACK
jgi:ribose transport system substrate-binding protein